jgi:hypothetical protein
LGAAALPVAGRLDVLAVFFNGGRLLKRVLSPAGKQ